MPMVAHVDNGSQPTEIISWHRKPPKEWTGPNGRHYLLAAMVRTNRVTELRGIHWLIIDVPEVTYDKQTQALEDPVAPTIEGRKVVWRRTVRDLTSEEMIGRVRIDAHDFFLLLNDDETSVLSLMQHGDANVTLDPDPDTNKAMQRRIYFRFLKASEVYLDDPQTLGWMIALAGQARADEILAQAKAKIGKE